MPELPGQMALFQPPYAVEVHAWERNHPIVEHTVTVTWQQAVPLCDVCGTACTSSKECMETAGLDEEDDW